MTGMEPAKVLMLLYSHVIKVMEGIKHPSITFASNTLE